jgi:hypothetical protein
LPRHAQQLLQLDIAVHARDQQLLGLALSHQPQPFAQAQLAAGQHHDRVGRARVDRTLARDRRGKPHEPT